MMKKLILDLEHCYGIKRLEAEFDFEAHGSVFTIYASNGVMKTSLANTFQDIHKGLETTDRIWRSNQTKRKITDEDGNDLTREMIFVIEPFNDSFRSEKISSLLVNEELRTRYNAVHQAVDNKADLLVQSLQQYAGLKNGLREQISRDILHESHDFFRALARVKDEVAAHNISPLRNVIYADIFNPKAEQILADPSFLSSVQEYIAKYDELVGKSTFFQKGIFTHNNASDIAKSLGSNGYFDANHSLYLSINNEKKEITTIHELKNAIQQEKDLILTNNELRSSFEAIDKQLQKNADLRKFRECLQNNQAVIGELTNLASLRQKLWIQYLIKAEIAYEELLQVYNRGRDEIKAIVTEAKSQRTQWAEVVRIFNERFSVPFNVRMDNIEDVILKSDAPIIRFEFLASSGNQQIQRAPVEEDQLKRVLSNGERRALYILNIIFEVEARKAAFQPTLFIVDDIADSFDYKNKYAIIEYLADISSRGEFRQLILSHNFDFYRTVSSRLGLRRPSRLLASKEAGAISLQEEHYQNNPFSYWRRNFANPVMLVASIPFLRNLAEFAGDDINYNRLTSLLHIKTDTDSFTVSILEAIIKTVLNDQSGLVLPDPALLVKQVIFREAATIASNQGDTPSLENKIALSIAIRLKAEEFMIQRINDPSFLAQIAKNQTIKLIKRYKADFPNEHAHLEAFNQVNLMTPENIHLNSFMYEPILDLSSRHLKQLYLKVSAF